MAVGASRPRRSARPDTPVETCVQKAVPSYAMSLCMLQPRRNPAVGAMARDHSVLPPLSGGSRRPSGSRSIRATELMYRGSRCQEVIERAATAPAGVAGIRPNHPSPVSRVDAPPPDVPRGFSIAPRSSASQAFRATNRTMAANPRRSSPDQIAPSTMSAGADQTRPNGVQPSTSATCDNMPGAERRFMIDEPATPRPTASNSTSTDTVSLPRRCRDIAEKAVEVTRLRATQVSTATAAATGATRTARTERDQVITVASPRIVVTAAGTLTRDDAR